jgi:hypothetical protein
MTAEEYDWLVETAEMIQKGRVYTPEPTSRERLLRLAPECGWRQEVVETLLGEHDGEARLIVKVARRVLNSGRKFSKALADLYSEKEGTRWDEGLQVMKRMAREDTVLPYRQEAQAILDAVERGRL